MMNKKLLTGCARMLAAVLLATVLSNCASGIERRIAKNPGIYNELSADDKAVVARGKIREGMSKGAVFIAWGAPARKLAGKKSGQPYERWTYLSFDAVPVHHFGMGWGYGRMCDYAYGVPYSTMGTSFEYVPYESGFVDFTNGRVTGFGVPR